MKKSLAIVLGSAIMLSVAGCASNQDTGVLAGGAIGGAVGSLFGSGSGKILAAVGGTVVGAVIGGSIGRSMDQQDQMRMQMALNGPPEEVTRWTSRGGDEYYVTPRPTYYHHHRQCREFTTKAIIGGKTQTIYGTACRKPDGSWKVVQE